ncbi:helix-turn-helix domain-containing protein [Streptomyces celluloflavus]|uniref:helix-turn-helix domain-containing protein n=1 Tax=Streptomyces celluloflavus TaxID=58344 RepID=UPI0036D16B38
MQILRQCRGVSRTVLTGLINMSASWVRRVENGQLQATSLEMILRAADLCAFRTSMNSPDTRCALTSLADLGTSNSPPLRAQ